LSLLKKYEMIHGAIFLCKFVRKSHGTELMNSYQLVMTQYLGQWMEWSCTWLLHFWRKYLVIHILLYFLGKMLLLGHCHYYRCSQQRRKPKMCFVFILWLDLLVSFQSVKLLLTHCFVSYLVLFPVVLRLGLPHILHHCIRNQRHLLEVSSAPLYPFWPGLQKWKKNFELFVIVLATNSPSFDVRSQSVDVLLQTSLGFLPEVVAFIWLLCGVGQVLCGRRRIRQVAVPQ
jgi:hypothetical protein